MFKKLKKLSHFLMITFLNFLRYGKHAPKYGELLWVDPKLIEFRMNPSDRVKHFGSNHVISGSVVSGEWYNDVKLVSNTLCYRSCYEHWVNGTKWEETERIKTKMSVIEKKGEIDGCRSLDDIYETVKREGGFRTQEELHGKTRYFNKGEGEIEIFIGPNGELIHGTGGNHRLALAKILNLNKIPVKIGVVHSEGITRLIELRKQT